MEVVFPFHPPFFIFHPCIFKCNYKMSFICSRSRSQVASIIRNSLLSLRQTVHTMLTDSASLGTSIHRVRKGKCECVCVVQICTETQNIYQQVYLQLSESTLNSAQSILVYLIYYFCEGPHADKGRILRRILSSSRVLAEPP